VVYISYAAAGFAALAAIFWFLSALVRTPKRFNVAVVRGGSPAGGHPLGATFVGTAHSGDFLVLANALKRQSCLNAIAAICAAISAILGGVGVGVAIAP
jgi:hypothetical protein